MIYYVCKYTPLELLEAFGGKCERLEPLPDNFDTADSLGHPNMCGYGKAIIEEVYANNIKELILVDCCDVIRRVYDILRESGHMDFVYLLELPHKNGQAEAVLFRKSLKRLAEAYKNYTGNEFNLELAMSAFKDEEKGIDENFISLMGAHGGKFLYETVNEKFSVLVRDDTCTGNRDVYRPKKKPVNFDDFIISYSQELLNQTPCMRMFDNDRRKELTKNSEGVIYHTMKFCDYYSFEYMNIKNTLDVPILKIETDCTSQSEGQLATRLEAFAETLNEGAHRRKIKMNSNGKVYTAGIDSGSTSTDAVIIDKDKKIIGKSIVPTGAGATNGAKKALSQALEQARLNEDDLTLTVTTGYGRENIGFGNSSVTEITCHARGAHYLNPKARTVIDIGGQDSKVIRIDENGAVLSFVMNDKCAAGTGRFLDMMARTMEISLEEMSELGLKWSGDVTISNMCTVFAESEVVSLVAQDTPPADIIHGLNKSVAGKTVSLVKRLGGESEYIMTGGVARNKGIVEAIEQKLGEKLFISDDSQLCGAIGAALIGMESVVTDIID
ncbi:MAG: acyl-CoA dehydratase activase [Candidatus Metalachnospira sp.]|nr:acyl-CoA dehydratase activase [Candidatus Metalachnospira sp.]